MNSYPNQGRRSLKTTAGVGFALGCWLLSFGSCCLADDGLRAEVRKLATETVSIAYIDATQLVNKSWDETNIELVIDTEVDRAIASAKREMSYGKRLWSGWSSKAARELAERVAGQVFSSAAFNKELRSVSERIALNLSKELEPKSADAAKKGLTSMQLHLGQQYSEHLRPVLARHLSDFHPAFAQDKTLATKFGDLASKHPTALSGAAVIVGSHLAKGILQRLANKITERIIGRIASRILGRVGTAAVPVVGWIIGGGMIAFDLIKGADGALPEIQKSLKSLETKTQIRNEMALAFKDELPKLQHEVAESVADEVYGIWRSFMEKYPTILTLTKESTLFRQEIVEKTPQDKDNFDKLSRLVEICMKAVGKVELLALVESGILQELKGLPEDSYIIIKESDSPKTLFKWHQAAKGQLSEVVRYAIYRHLQPNDLEEGQLRALLRIGDAKAIERLLRQKLPDLKTALKVLPPDRVQSLVKLLDEQAMRTMIMYADVSGGALVDELLKRISDQPALARFIGHERLSRIFLNRGNIEDLNAFFATENRKEVAVKWLLPIGVVCVVAWFSRRHLFKPKLVSH